MFAGRRLLIAGVGGGADCVTAWALGRWLQAVTTPASVVIANAKKPGYLQGMAPRTAGGDIYDPDPQGHHFFLDTRLPDGRACLVMRCPEKSEPWVIRGLQALDFDHILAVDTGADVVTRHGRDWRTYQALRATGKPITLALVSPGSDGQEQENTLRQGVSELADQGSLLGHQRAEVLKPFISKAESLLRDYAARYKPPGEQSTLVIGLETFGNPPSERVVVKRDTYPEIPARWLQGMWFFDCTAKTET